jgi:hypothetical protein
MALIAVAAVGALAVVALLASRDGDSRPRSRPCEAVREGAIAWSRGERTDADLLTLVREQVAPARADAERDPRLLPVADAIEDIRDSLEAGRRFREFIILDDACG